MNTPLKKFASSACKFIALTVLALLGGSVAHAQIATGNDHTLAIQTGGNVYAWGFNYYGQLGNNTTTSSTAAVEVLVSGGTALSNISGVAGGQNHSAAFDKTGGAWAWGYNAYGQLGTGNTTNSSVATPIKNSSGNLTGVIAVATGDNFTLALKSDGSVWATGLNSNGQLGNGTTTQQTLAVQVRTSASAFLTNIVAIAAGTGHSIALDSAGNVWTWGANNYGQLGLGNTTQQTYAQQVTTISGIGQIAAGANHSLAMPVSGTTVYSWGLNSYGQLGNNTNTQENSPVTMTGVSNAKTVAAGASHSVILETDGSVWTCGRNYLGELGLGSTIDQHVAVQVSVSAVVSIAARDDRTLMLNTNGQILGVGDDYYGGLGDNKVGYQLSPYNVSALSGVSQVSSGNNGYHSLAVTTGGAVYAAGWNTYGQLGNNNMVNSFTFAQVQTSSGFLTGITQAAAGGAHSLALTSGGTVYAWGEAVYGEVGNGVVTSYVLLPSQVVTASGALTGITAVSAGQSHSLALDSSGHVWAWGSNSVGQLGNNTTTNSNKAVQVLNTSGTALSNIVSICAGSNHSLAVDSTGNVWAWGYNNAGQLGDGTTTNRLEAEQINLSGTTVKAVSGGGFFTLFLTNAGTVLACGINSYGDLGDGTTTQRLTPVSVLNLSSVSAVYAGQYHAMAVESNGSVWTWGNNSDGALGNGTIDFSTHSTPAQISGITAKSGSNPGSSAGYHNMLLNSSGAVTAWGNGIYGQLGDGQFGYAASPVTAAFTVAVDTTGLWVDGTNGHDTNPGSYTLPYATVKAAITQMEKTTNTNTRITIRAGTYYENVPLRSDFKFPSGTATTPIVVRGMPGERAIISGMKQITGWSLSSGSVYSTTVSTWANAANKCPETFYMGGSERLMAQLPAPGTAPWVFPSGGIVFTGGNMVITDPAHLAGIPSLVGGYCQLTIALANYASTGIQGAPIIAHDTTNGIITLQGTWNTVASYTGNYIVKNTPACVTQPGEWACVSTAGAAPFTMYYWPKNSTEISQLTSANPPSQARASYTTGLNSNQPHGDIVLMYKVNYVNVQGLEITGAAGDASNGVNISSSNNCNVQWCTIHDNGGYNYQANAQDLIEGYAVMMRDSNNCMISNNVMTLNNLGGVDLYGASNNAIEQNDIGWNRDDGIDVQSDGYNSTTQTYSIPSANNTIAQNYIHHQFNLTEHPDAIQPYDSDVTGLNVSDNVMLAQVQISINGLGSGGFIGNVIWPGHTIHLGSPGLGGTVGAVYFDNNTTEDVLQFDALQPVNAQQNVVQGRWLGCQQNYTGDYNFIQPVLTGTNTYDIGQMTAKDTSNVWHTWSYNTPAPGCVTDFSNWFLTNTGTAEDAHSYVPSAPSTPLFNNMPTTIFIANYINGLQYFTTNSTSTTVALVTLGGIVGTGDIAVGSHIEFNMDGVVRTVSTVNATNSTITFSPALSGYAPGDGLGWPTLARNDIIENWGSRTNFHRDSTLVSTSPGLTMGPGSTPVGSTLNIGEYQADDFLGTGVPCVPAIPSDIQANIAEHNWHFSPWFSYGNN